MEKESVRKTKILGLIGILLFVVVLLVLYLIILIGQNIQEEINLEYLAPLVIFTGFFIFLVGSVLVGLSIFKICGGFK
jgi:uncharacterized integral membrane protein